MPAMSRKTYSAVAEAIRAERPNPDETPDADTRHAVCDTLTERVADIFAADNPRFDRTRFRAATERN